MQKQQNNTKLISKERIPTLKFSKKDVLQDSSEKSRRYDDANRATILSNTNRNKSMITFKTASGEKKCVEATLWGLDKDFVLLRSGMFLPLRSILEINYC
ncbi:hypothetical protein POKO110462_06140 [Pontibacter korlensis]|uniref:Uncharacterized protein n=1 Tax=Pontibacter korlensis TaxID=400092 RepID=A0A0E3ZE77_9BACT|nr:hypothetical protein [Pontibacter korlensis]AKD03513.1 hypothetical protein PKOR_10705 [Pontibacter korlensis]